jgi:hypothetical protein
LLGDEPIIIEQFFYGFEGDIMGSNMGSQNIMGSDYGSNISDRLFLIHYLQYTYCGRLPFQRAVGGIWWKELKGFDDG